jgi:hypothetical protein
MSKMVLIEYLGLDDLNTAIKNPNDGRCSPHSAVTMSLTRVKILFDRVSQFDRSARFVDVRSIIFNIACKLRARVTIVEGSSPEKF